VVEDVPNVVPQFLTAFGMWLDVRVGAPCARALGNVDAETQEFETFLPSVQQTRLGFVEFQLPAFQPAFESLEIRCSSAFGTENDEIISVTHHQRDGSATVVDGLIQGIEVEVRRSGEITPP